MSQTHKDVSVGVIIARDAKENAKRGSPAQSLFFKRCAFKLKRGTMVQINKVERPNPQDLTAQNKFYAQVKASGKTDLERLAYLVSNQSTVREGDCYAVILSLIHNIIDELKQGRTVKLDKLGTFRLSVRSEGAANQAEVTQSNIKSVHVNFLADKRLKNGLNTNTVTFTLSQS